MRAAPDEANLPRAKIQRRDTRTFCVLGPMTFDSVTDLWRQSEEMFSGETVFQIDLAQVTRTDSAGLALLVQWMREASRQGARVELLNLPTQMLALADAANLEEALVGKRGMATS